MLFSKLKYTSGGFHIALLLSFFLLAYSLAQAERLAIKSYTTADGLAHNRVHFILQDSHGFIWFCTRSGLSRFDGYRFTTYSTEQGLPDPTINYMLESRKGIYWIATNGGGVCRFDPSAKGSAANDASRSHFLVYPVGDALPTNRVNALYEDHLGRIWAGTDGGLFRLDDAHNQQGFTRIDLGISIGTADMVEDRRGALWTIANGNGLYRVLPDGQVERYSIFSPGLMGITQDREGRVWVATRQGLCLLVDEPKPNLPVVARVYTTADGLPDNYVTSIFQSADGLIWVGTWGGLAKFDGQQLRSYTTAQGLSENRIRRLTEDRDGNLWMCTPEAGVIKLTRNGFTAFDKTDSPGLISITSSFEDQSGEVYLISNDCHINRPDHNRFTSIRPAVAENTPALWMGQTAFLDHTGQWWILTDKGLYHFPKVNRIEELRHVRPLAAYTIGNGLPSNQGYRIFEDSRGDLWIGMLNARNGLVRWERATETLHQYTEAHGLQVSNAAFSFCEDRSGNIWIGFYDGGLVKYSAGHFTNMSVSEGWPAGMITGLYLDHTGRLWITSNRAGLIRVDDPEGEHPKLKTYSIADGLATVDTRCVTEDRWSRIYVGTARGVDRLETDSGRFKHYTTADGLSNDFVISAFCDSRNQLWFGTMEGISRLIPEPDRPQPPPSVLIGGLRIAGVTQQISEFGESQIAELELAANQNQVEVDFFGLSFGSGGALRYQYFLEGLNRDWGTLSDQRTVNYASLAPGTYRFFVRAINTDGAISSLPASLAFRILPPVWRRWWFLSLATGLLGTLAFVFLRLRYQRMKAVRESENRFRTLAETASDAIISVDESGTIVFINQAAEKTFGYGIEEMKGNPLTMLMPEYLRHLHEAGFKRYRETGKRHIGWEAIELPGLHKNGQEIPLELSFGEFTKDDKMYVTGIARDISERKRAEEERQQAEEALRRSREERLIELERVRRRIATDLHDDIGSSLTRIVILSEVAQQKAKSDRNTIDEQLTVITDVSNELVEAMSDIVWAINPQKDHLHDLSQRMRRFASDIFTARGIEFRFQAPDPNHHLQLGANIRRELFLVFKESVNNIAKHSQCSRADCEFQIADDSLTLKLSDNGRGFDLQAAISDNHLNANHSKGGNGLLSMQRRVEESGGEFKITSSIGQGTSVFLKVPVSGEAFDKK